MSIEIKQGIRVLIVLMCVLIFLAACAVNNPTPAPTAQPNVSPLTAQSPVQLPPLSGTVSPCEKGCLEPTQECTVKGIVTGMGDRFYYTPDMPGYRTAKLLIPYGGRWFCTVDEAVRNGFTKDPSQ
jgi:hypothetical protein